MVKKQHVGLVNIIPAFQKVTVIPISDLKNNPKKKKVLEIRSAYGLTEASPELTFSTSL